MKLRLVWIFAVSLLLAVPSTLCGYTFEVQENTAANVLIGRVNFTYAQITQFDCDNYVNISGNELRTAVELDREQIRDNNGEVDDTLHCIVTLIDSSDQREITEKIEIIEITVLDENDNTPYFRELDQVHVMNITENFNIPNSLVKLQAVDDDKGDNGTVVFHITAGNEENFFYIGLPLEYNGTDPNREELFFNRTVDFEQYQIFNLTIIACDKGILPLCFEQIIVVEIIDVNDEGPYFPMSRYNPSVKENHPLGPQNGFANITALDRDTIPSVLVYSIEGAREPTYATNYIGVNNETGELYLKKAIDYETELQLRTIRITLIAREVGRPEVAFTNVHITVVNVNDVMPTIRIEQYSMKVPENKNLLQFPIRLSVYDEDGINEPVVKLHPPVDYNMLNIQNSNFIITINASFDREKVEKISVNFTVYDKGAPSLPATETLLLDVLDENDNSPNFTQVEYNAIVGDNAPLHKVVATVRANDPDFAENGSLSYTISSVNPPIAHPWFDIDTLTGEITVSGVLDYSLVESVSITVEASDNGTTPLNSSATVNIDLSPSVTFKPRSYQEHCSPYVNIRDASQIYLEFRTSEKSGLLIYEETAEGEPFALGIKDGRVIAIDQNIVQNNLDVSTNDWIAVLYNFEQKLLIVSHSEQQPQRENILRSSEIVRCDSGSLSSDSTFFVGGINVLFYFQNVTESSDFIGTIRNLIIDSVQIDLLFPTREENTARGMLFTSEPMCGELETTCSGPHYAGCLDYDTESRCICVGGFNTEACSEEKNYSPIQLSTSSKLQLVVDDYALFFDLAQRSALIGASDTVPTTSISRRRRALNDINGYQLVEFQFRLLKKNAGPLLISQTDTSIHKLKIAELHSETLIVYTVSDTDGADLKLSSFKVHIAEPLEYVLGDLYTVVVNMTSTHISVSFNGTRRTEEWTTVLPFIQYPRTVIGLGGEDVDSGTSVSGCIARLAVNDIEFPLNGLVENNDQIVTVSGGSGSSVSTTCDLCQQEVSPCHETSQCINQVDSFSCECPTGLVPGEEDECIEPPTPKSSPIGPPTTDSPSLPLYYIIGGAAVAVVVVALLVTIMCCVCCRRQKKENQKKTYCVGGDHQLPQLGSPLHRSRPNSYSDVPRRPSLCNSEPSYVSRHEGSVSTTYNEHDVDEDNESNTQNMTRSKSSTSGETGFHTASERDDQRSLPRMDDSGNEKETDYSPFDSESDESQSYIGEHSTPNVSLGNAKSRGLTLQPPISSPSLGPISSIKGAPLTPKEKKCITPLRPDSRSELGEETDLDTDFSSTAFVRQTGSGRYYRGGSLKLPGRPDSGMSGHQWYKSSTSSDTERERKRAEASHTYYPPNQFQSFRRPRATSASSPQHIIQHVNPQRSLTPPHVQISRSKRRTHANSPPISPLTSYNHHNTLPSRAHTKERDTSKKIETSEMSPSVLSRSQPLKMHHPFFRQYSDSPRVPAHLAAQSYIPSYIRTYSEESTSRKGEKQFVDLGSVRTNCDPIQYWEGQKRMMATVDQVDAYPVLSESFTHFEDSAAESQQSGPEHQSFSNQGGGEGTAAVLDMELLRESDVDSVATGTTLKGSEHESKVILFPSADCSEEYRCTSRIKSTPVGTSGSDLLHHSCSIPPSQGTFEV